MVLLCLVLQGMSDPYEKDSKGATDQLAHDVWKERDDLTRAFREYDY